MADFKQSQQEGLRWHWVRTTARFEQKVKLALTSRIKALRKEALLGDIVILEEKVVELVGGKQKVKKKILYPGYLLVEMILNDEMWHVIRGLPQRIQVAGVVSKEEVQDLISKAEQGKATLSRGSSFAVGESVRLKEEAGLFSNWVGVVESVNPEKGKLKVAVKLLGNPHPVNLSFNQVEKM